MTDPGPNAKCRFHGNAHPDFLCGGLTRAEAETLLTRLENIRSATAHEIEQTLGTALGYPWYKDDQKNFPGATEADGVCVGEHVPESIAGGSRGRNPRPRSEGSDRCSWNVGQFTMSDRIRLRPTEKHCQNFYAESSHGMYQVTAYPPIRVSERETDGGFLSVAYLDSCCRDAHSWRARVRRAWRALWGCPDTEVYFEDVGDVERVCATLRAAAKVAFSNE